MPGVVYHLISRFVGGRYFIRDDEERANYLRLFGLAISKSDWRCLAYAVMSSHIHLALVAGEMPLAQWIVGAHSTFASWMNRRRGDSGPMFVRGPTDHAVPPARVASCIAYLHNNPVRAKVAVDASASSWTSHRAYVGATLSPSWLAVEEGLRHAGTDAATFDAWVRATPGDGCRPDLGRARKSVQRLGAIEVATPTAAATVVVPLVIRSVGYVRVDPTYIVDVTIAALGARLIDVRSRQRSPLVVSARRVIVHAGVALGVSQADLAAALD